MINRNIDDITNFIFINDLPQKSDVILIPGSSRHEITEKAAELYHAGYAPYILPSGLYSLSCGHFAKENITKECYKGNFSTDFEYCRHILVTNGVPENAILCEDRATNTMENAMYSAEVIHSLGLTVKRAIICCQAFHARRAYMTYACHFTNVELLVVASETQNICSKDWYKNEKTAKKVLSEVEKCGHYFKDFTSQLLAHRP